MQESLKVGKRKFDAAPGALSLRRREGRALCRPALPFRRDEFERVRHCAA
jgi:hypothetical protein